MHRPTLILATTALALAAPLTVAACGPSSEERRAAEAVEQWHDALADRDAKKACALMTPASRKAFEVENGTWLMPGSCESSLTVATSLMSERERDMLGEVEVRGAEVDGDRATVLQEEVAAAPLLEQEYKRPFRLVRLDGRWLLEAETKTTSTKAGG